MTSSVGLRYKSIIMAWTSLYGGESLPHRSQDFRVIPSLKQRIKQHSSTQFFQVPSAFSIIYWTFVNAPPLFMMRPWECCEYIIVGGRKYFGWNRLSTMVDRRLYSHASFLPHWTKEKEQGNNLTHIIPTKVTAWPFWSGLACRYELP